MIRIDLTKARSLVHAKRRQARAEELTPWDLKVTIPAEAQKAEAERQKIREKYAALQNEIDAARDIDALTVLFAGLGATPQEAAPSAL